MTENETQCSMNSHPQYGSERRRRLRAQFVAVAGLALLASAGFAVKAGEQTQAKAIAANRPAANRVTLTNRDGRVFESITIVRTNANSLAYVGTNGISSETINFADLPEPLPKKYGPTPAAGEAVQPAPAPKKALSREAAWQELKQEAIYLRGLVTEKRPDGLLVRSFPRGYPFVNERDARVYASRHLEGGVLNLAATMTVQNLGKAPVYDGVVLLQDYVRQSSEPATVLLESVAVSPTSPEGMNLKPVSPQTIVKCLAYPLSVSHATFTCNVEKAMAERLGQTNVSQTRPR